MLRQAKSCNIVKKLIKLTYKNLQKVNQLFIICRSLSDKTSFRLYFLIFIASILFLSYDKDPVQVEEKSQAKLVFVMMDSTVGPGGIYTMNLDGSNLKPAAVEGDSVYFPGYWGDYYVLGNYAIGNPHWSPDGSKIACQLEWAFDVSVNNVIKRRWM